MEGIFLHCSNLSDFPIIPNGVTNLTSAFANTAIVTMPEMPDSVTIMNNTFGNCTNLTNIDIKIPSSVKNLSHTFREDTNLSGKITIEATPDKYENCFYHTSTNINTELIISGPEESRDILIQIIGTKSNKSNIKGDWN